MPHIMKYQFTYEKLPDGRGVLYYEGKPCVTMREPRPQDAVWKERVEREMSRINRRILQRKIDGG